MAAPTTAPNQTLYIRNLNEKIKLEGARRRERARATHTQDARAAAAAGERMDGMGSGGGEWRGTLMVREGARGRMRRGRNGMRGGVGRGVGAPQS